MPSPSQMRVVDPILSSVAQGYIHPEHVGSNLFPRVSVRKSGGQILEFGKESFKLYSTRRAPGSATRRIHFGFLGKSFALTDDSLEVTVPREYLRETEDLPNVDLAKRAVDLGMKNASLQLEYEQSLLATSSANYDANHKIALAGADKWSDDACNPGVSVDNGKEAVRSSIGIYPNTLLLSAAAYKAAKNNPNVVERFKYTGRDSITPQMLAALWDLEKVVVGKGVIFDDAGASSDIWGNNAILAYVPSAPSSHEEPSFGYTYTMEGHPLVEKPYYDNNTKSWMYPTTYERAPVLSGILSGYLIQNPA